MTPQNEQENTSLALRISELESHPNVIHTPLQPCSEAFQQIGLIQDALRVNRPLVNNGVTP
jgi:hypothetical protein